MVTKYLAIKELPICPLAEKWIIKGCCYTMEYYVASRKDKTRG